MRIDAAGPDLVLGDVAQRVQAHRDPAGRDPAQRRRELTGRARWWSAEHARLRLLLATELTRSVRTLREDTRHYLDRADAEARRDYPALLATAVAGLAARHLAHTRSLMDGAARRVTAGLDVPAPHAPTGPPPPAPAPLPARGRWPAEDRVAALATVSAVIGAGRLVWSDAALPRPLAVGAVTALTLAVSWWLTATRRAAGDRARLTRWTAEVLADARAHLDATVATQLLELDRQARAALARAAEQAGSTHTRPPNHLPPGHPARPDSGPSAIPDQAPPGQRPRPDGPTGARRRQEDT